MSDSWAAAVPREVRELTRDEGFDELLAPQRGGMTMKTELEFDPIEAIAFLRGVLEDVADEERELDLEVVEDTLYKLEQWVEDNR
jgi:hypothetical protein